MLLKKHEESAAEFRKATLLDPTYAAAWFQLGIVLEEKGDLDLALDAYAKTFQIDPDHDQAVLRSADIRQRQNRMEEALELYNEALRLQPRNFMACNNAGNVAKYMGRIAEALAWYKKAQELEPGQRICASNYLMALLLSADCSPEEIYRKHAMWSDTFEKPCEHLRKQCPNSPAPNRPATSRTIRWRFS